jgi:hypothetical protein
MTAHNKLPGDHDQLFAAAGKNSGCLKQSKLNSYLLHTNISGIGRLNGNNISLNFIF